MGLAERKLVQAAKDGDFKHFQDEINQLCGKEVKLNFDWSTVESHSEGKSILENKRYKSFMFDRIVLALKNIASDDMGKTALKETLKEIHMIPEAGAPSFEGGILTIRNDLTGNGAYSAEHIQQFLEKNL